MEYFIMNSSFKQNQYDNEFTSPAKVRHYRFAQEYLRLNFNATQAYLAVYGEEYKVTNGKAMTLVCAKASGSRLLSDVTVNNFIAKLTKDALAAADVSVNSVIAKYKRWSEFDVRSVLGWENLEKFKSNGKSYNPKRYHTEIVFKDMKDIPEEAWECIESISQGSEGFIVKFVSKMKALNALAKYVGIDRKSIEQSTGITITFDAQDSALC